MIKYRRKNSVETEIMTKKETRSLAMKKILFQGDSITDSQRFKEYDDHLGTGYALMVAGELGYNYPGEYEFINKGVSGNKSDDVLARTENDIIAVCPDVMSLLIGVNDVWHHIGDDVVLPFTENCSQIIERTKAAFPNIKLMMLEPFVLEGYETCACEENPKRWEKFKNGVALRARLTRELCEKYSIKFIPLQEKFDKAAEKTGGAYWLIDGVHPSPAGHELIAREWIKAFGEL